MSSATYVPYRDSVTEHIQKILNVRIARANEILLVSVANYRWVAH